MNRQKPVGIDILPTLGSKKHSSYFTLLQGKNQINVGVFFQQLLGWIIKTLVFPVLVGLRIFNNLLRFAYSAKRFSFSSLHWGRQQNFSIIGLLFALVGISATSFFTESVKSAQPRIDQVQIEQATDYIRPGSSDLVIEVGSLITNMPQKVKRLEVKTYIVEYEDTLGNKTLDTIAKKFEITADSIRWANNYTSKKFQPKVGAKIKIPPMSGSLYTVSSSDTLISIAKMADLSPQVIAETNFLAPPYQVKKGQVLFLVETAPIPSGGNALANGLTLFPIHGGKFLLWPVPSSAVYSQCYLPYHDGIDINPANGGNPPVVAAAAGKVVKAGYKCDGYLCGYAVRVEIDHGNGYSTLYGHLRMRGGVADGITVGSYVRQGQVIGYMGSSGWSTGTHLHFRLSHNGRVINPAPYLANAHGCR